MGEIAERITGAVAKTAGNTVGPSVSALMAAAAVVTGNADLALWATPVGAAFTTFTEEGVLLARRAWTDRAERVHAFAEAVAEEAKVPFDHVPLLAVDSTRVRQLLGVTVEAASEAQSDWKIRMLAKAFVEGHKDPAKVDEMIFLTEAVKNLDVLDIRLLATLSSYDWKMETEPQFMQSFRDFARERDAALHPIFAFLLAHLRQAGLIKVDDLNFTDQGKFCVTHLRRLGALPTRNDSP